MFNTGSQGGASRQSPQQPNIYGSYDSNQIYNQPVPYDPWQDAPHNWYNQ